MSTRPAIARLKVTLEDVEPAVMRRLDVPLRIRLDRLHLVLQAAMGWTNSHLYEFRAGGASWGDPDPDFEHIVDELDRLARRWAPRPRKPKTTSPRS
jgi:Plasmid pRiA4b ORF-3-like protein